MSLSAIRYVASTSKFAVGSFYLQCHVKPSASKQREGIVSISETVIEICVSATAREGEANKAVKELFSKVSLAIVLDGLLKMILGSKMPQVGCRDHSGLKIAGQDCSYREN